MNMRVHRFVNSNINQAGYVELKVRMEKMCGGLRQNVFEKAFLKSVRLALLYILFGFGRRGSLQQLNLS